jgi:hypothetical protein
MPTFALAYNDKYYGGGSGSGNDFVWYVAIVGGLMLINWIREQIKRNKE